MRYEVNADYFMLDVDGEHLLVRLDHRFGATPKATAMNPTAALYWEMLTEGLDTHGMLERMQGLCKSGESISEAGLNAFLASLEGIGAITQKETI